MPVTINYVKLLPCIIFFAVISTPASSQIRPNIIIIITDDQGYGDFGINGNPHVKTPVIDKFARESVVFNNFYVTPVCATTRSELMTGRYSLRTGIRDTYNGGATMASGEITIAEMLKTANYKTGIFGKWHLGDNYPSRPNDQGFDESLIHLSGGMGQVGDITTYFKGDSSYFNPTLWHNGKQEAYQGYCSDIFTEEAVEFIQKNQKYPFFCYLSFNAPHTPLQVPDEYYQRYKDIDPAEGFNDERPFVTMTENDKEAARKVYAMVNNIDDNIGKLLDRLDQLGIAENTIVIFMTDNGPQQHRYIAGMRGKKGSVYRGGVRVPLYMRYPKLLKSHKEIGTNVAVIDILPTIAQICDVNSPSDRTIDGKNLLPLIQEEAASWEERPLFFYWTRRYPELYNNIAVQKGAYKLVGHTGFDAPVEKFELFNIASDPYEQSDLIADHPDIAVSLKSEMDNIYMELITSENMMNPPRTIIGSKEENPLILNRNDADGERGIWAQEDIFGKWQVSIVEGTYDFTFKFIKPVGGGGRMFLETKTMIHQSRNNVDNTDIITMNKIKLPAMECDLIPFYEIDGRRIFPFWVEISKID